MPRRAVQPSMKRIPQLKKKLPSGLPYFKASEIKCILEGHKQTWFLVNSGTVKGKSKGRQAIQILLNSLRNDASFLCFLHKLITMKKNSKAETTIGCWVPVFMRICEQDHQDLIYQKLEIAIWVGSSIRSDKLGIKHLF